MLENLRLFLDVPMQVVELTSAQTYEDTQSLAFLGQAWYTTVIYSEHPPNACILWEAG